MKIIYTSYFANKLVPAGTGVSIARMKPEWWEGPSIMALAPTYAMLRMSDENYGAHYQAILRRLDPVKMLAKIPEGTVLLCWEKYQDDCHRKDVAEWLNRSGLARVEEYRSTVKPKVDPQMDMFPGFAARKPYEDRE